MDLMVKPASILVLPYYSRLYASTLCLSLWSTLVQNLFAETICQLLN